MNNTVLSCIIMTITAVLGILYHEYGHMKQAKKHHINVNTFCIGFGNPIIRYKGKDSVTYGIAPFPFGGYCSMDDEELNKSSLKVYISVLLAGVIRNFIFGTILIVIGQLLIANRFVNPVFLLNNALQSFGELLASFGDGIKNMFNLKAMASYGGIVSQMTTTSDMITSTSKTLRHASGMSLIMGGLINYMLVIFNLLPVPGIDGGQIVVRLICDFCKKVLQREIDTRIILAVNLFFILLLSCYQGLILLFDIPWVRNIFLGL